MKIKTDEITSVLKQEIEQFGGNELEVSEVGRVVEVGDGIARYTDWPRPCPVNSWNSTPAKAP